MDLDDDKKINCNNSQNILYREVKSVKAGEIERFYVTYKPFLSSSNNIIHPKSLWLKIQNLEPIALRAAYLIGPFFLYLDCVSDEYESLKKCFITEDQPTFESRLLPGKAFYYKLSCHTIKNIYNWKIDIISQLLFNNVIKIKFEIAIGFCKESLKKIPSKFNKTGLFIDSNILTIINQNTYEIWNLPKPEIGKPIHLVILTHGLHSNVGVDMLYIKEQINKICNPNVVVKGYFGNVGKTENGVKYLGTKVAEYIIDLVTNNETFNNNKVKKISFIGHSLGGLVQIFAIGYLNIKHEWFFQSITPETFITLATPLLGVLENNSTYVKLALLFGLAGKSGYDLGLKNSSNNTKPLLSYLSSKPVKNILKMFKKRTLYANVLNDGVVQLKTAALLYLDYKSINEKLIANGSNEKHKIDESDLLINNNENKNKLLHNILNSDGLSFFFNNKKKLKNTIKNDSKYLNSNFLIQNDSNHGKKKSIFDENLSNLSMIETAISLIYPPEANIKFISNPELRSETIIHDKLYTELDIEKYKDSRKEFRKTKDISQKQSFFRHKVFNSFELKNENEYVEEELAKAYHKDMDWRKVVVKLEPDAHNNIIVRRKFSNAFGWEVIKHLINNHFKDDDDSSDFGLNIDSVNPKIKVSSNIPNTTFIKKKQICDELSNIEQSFFQDDLTNNENDLHWFLDQDNFDSVFFTGPSGMISGVSGIVSKFKNSIFKSKKKSP